MDGIYHLNLSHLYSSKCVIVFILLVCVFHCLQGTLLNSKSQITARNAEALREARSRGVNIVIATGKVLYFLCSW